DSSFANLVPPLHPSLLSLHDALPIFELDHLLVEGVPPLVGQRWVLPVPARRIRVQVAANEPEFLDAALELCDAVGRRHARGLRQDRKSTRLNSSHQIISYAVFCLKNK